MTFPYTDSVRSFGTQYIEQVVDVFTTKLLFLLPNATLTSWSVGARYTSAWSKPLKIELVVYDTYAGGGVGDYGAAMDDNLKINSSQFLYTAPSGGIPAILGTLETHYLRPGDLLAREYVRNTPQPHAFNGCLGVLATSVEDADHAVRFTATWTKARFSPF